MDLDPKCNVSWSYGASLKGPTCKDLLDGTLDTADAIQKKSISDIIASNEDLYRADFEYLSVPDKEYLLRKSLNCLMDEYDFCILDTPSSRGLLTVNALTMANYVVIPALPDILSLEGVKTISVLMKEIKDKTNPGLVLLGVVLNCWKDRINIYKTMAQSFDALTTELGTELFSTKIRDREAIRIAQFERQEFTELDGFVKLLVEILRLSILLLLQSSDVPKWGRARKGNCLMVGWPQIN